MSICINPGCSNPDNPETELFCQDCGSELLIDNRYKAIGVLGQGGFGKTFELQSKYEERKVLKVLIRAGQKAEELFQREADFLKQNKHSGIPKADSNSYFIFYPRDENTPLHCLVMEKIEGKNLKEYIQQRGGRPIQGHIAKEWLSEIASILVQVHRAGIIHRDIKPQNIIIRPNGSLALIDFGAVGSDDSPSVTATETATVTGTESNTKIGSKGYSAPEQMRGSPLKASDIYALGMTFIYLLTGKEAEDKAMYDAYEDSINWKPHTEGVTTELARLIDSMIERKASQRPSDAQELLTNLQAIGRKKEKGQDVGVTLEINGQEAKLGARKEISIARRVNVNNVFELKTAKFNITVPKDSKTGNILRLAGQGNHSTYGCDPGDLYIRLIIHKSQPLDHKVKNTDLESRNSLSAQLFSTAQEWRDKACYLEAIRLLNEALRESSLNDPDKSQVHTLIGDIYYENMHQKVMSKPHYMKALKADPNNEIARQKLQNIKNLK